jgi:molybdenum ABC transporter molybdate-binding protein
MSASRPNTTNADAAWGEGWGVGLHVWVERAGQAILGPGRLELLDGIDRHRSISAAARQMGMSYRRAWVLVQSINEAAGAPLVQAATGGTGGGGAQLTPLGHWAVRIFHELQDQLRQTAAGLLPRVIQRPASTTLHVAAAVSLEEVLSQLLTDFALREPTVRVRTVFGASDELADHLAAGAPADLFLTADPGQLDRLEAAGGLVRRRERVALAENGLAAITLASCDLALHRPAELVRREGLRIALADPDCPLGGYTRAYLEHQRLYDRLAPRAIHVENSRAVVGAVRGGQADAGIVYSSDAARANGCRTLFRVRRTPVPIRYTAAVIHRGADSRSARRLLDFLASEAAWPRFRQGGFYRVGPR